MVDYDREADRASDAINAWWNRHRSRPIGEAERREFDRLLDYFDAAVETAFANLRRARAEFHDLRGAVVRRSVSDSALLRERR